MSLQTRVSIFITLIIVGTSVISTYLFATVHRRSAETGRITRGVTLSYALSQAAEEGLINENLDLLKKASSIVQAPDVTLAQVYSNIWDALDAYPVRQLKEQPLPGAVAHFRSSSAPLYLKTNGGYDFYTPIFFKASDTTPPVIIGFARIILSSAGIKEELRQIVLASIAVSAIITLLAIISLNILMRRLVMRPLMALYRSVSLFKNGTMPDIAGMPGKSTDEFRELSLEFNRMCGSIKEKEERLVESDRRIRSLFDRVEHAIFKLDGKGSIVETNSRFKTLFGNVTQLCEILMGHEDTAECLGKAASQTKGLHIEENAVGKNGEELVISLALYPERGADGALSGFDGYIIDITEKKRLEERLIRAQKMEAVGTLAGGMAHDFNNLLTAILGYAEIILMKAKEGDPFYKPATIIYEAATRGADFGKKVLSITRKEKIETKAVSINDIVKNSMELLLRSIPRNIEIVTHLREEVPHIKADTSQLEQVIMNLAVNARDAMPNGGRLSIETAAVGRESGTDDAAPGAGGEFVKLSISDTGMGIDRKIQGKIFDPFFTTKDMGKGTGLGLYIVNSIISNHGGYINLYSEPRKGTQFNIYLPATKSAENGETQDVEDIRGTGTILVIDDESDIRDLCRDMLEPLGYTVLIEENGRNGIRIFREMKDTISLVVLDMIMPGMGGEEVYRALKTIQQEVKVLLCSGYSRSGFAGIDDLMKQGACGFVQKPFSRRAIALAIKEALSK